MFTSLSSVGPSSSPCIFTDSSVDLFPDHIEFSTGTLTLSPDQSAILSNSVDPSPDLDDPLPVTPSVALPLRRSTRVSKPNTHLSDFHCYLPWILSMSLTLFPKLALTPFGSKQ
ncbi:hypothetical protein CFOL_v3_04456 [Cephalotus follicularis]|uniref:Uncharacterized protein n=1 Tax=Cephalotus follicularis TaxID=3775 RepID=A0A1Q3AZ01_CEPFO|nr:hypothetical protein CFOL_v3_04456 [Cephalotus follicularis]